MNYWQFKFDTKKWHNWKSKQVGDIEDWRFPRLKKYRDITVGDLVSLYRTDKKRGVYFVAKIINIDLNRNNKCPIDLKIIKVLKDNIFKPEENGYENIIKKINKLGQNGGIYRFSKEDKVEKLFELLTFDEIFPEEINTCSNEIYEGAKKEIVVNRYERDQKARKLCIENFGYSCQVCGINFEEVYGDIGKDFIHVHHLIPLHYIKKEYKIDPIKDLVPVCPNCHAMLHKKAGNEPYTINELKNMLRIETASYLV